ETIFGLAAAVETVRRGRYRGARIARRGRAPVIGPDGLEHAAAGALRGACRGAVHAVVERIRISPREAVLGLAAAIEAVRGRRHGSARIARRSVTDVVHPRRL